MARKIRLPRIVQSALLKARESALLAVEIYNKPAVTFRTGGFISLMVIAWTALFHAVFLRKGIQPYHRREGRLRYEKVEGDYKHWELAECLRQYWKDQNPPERCNLDLVSRLRNKVEHRTIPELDREVFGECQACLLNFEDLLVKEFGEWYSINVYLTLPLQISRTPRPAELRASAGWDSVRQFVQGFRTSLSTEVCSDMRYCFQIFLVPKIGNRPSEGSVAVEFVRYDPNNPEEMAKYEKVTALIKERQVPVINLGGMKPGEVVRRVRAAGYTDFGMGIHTMAWKSLSIRPSHGCSNPAKCNNEFCVYDVVHRDYVYTEKWVAYLTELLQAGKLGPPRKGNHDDSNSSGG